MGLSICCHFEFNYILNLYVLSMCFVHYLNRILRNLCNAAPMLFFRFGKFWGEFWHSPCAPGTYAALSLFCCHQKIARSHWGYSPWRICDPNSHLPSQISKLSLWCLKFQLLVSIYEFNLPLCFYVEACIVPPVSKSSQEPNMACRLGRLLTLPNRTLVCPVPIVGRPPPRTISLNTLSAWCVCLSLVQSTLCGEHQSHF